MCVCGEEREMSDGMGWKRVRAMVAFSKKEKRVNRDDLSACAVVMRKMGENNVCGEEGMSARSRGKKVNNGNKKKDHDMRGSTR